AELISAGDPEAAHAAGSRLNWRSLLRRGSVWLLFLRAVASNLADVFFVYWIVLYLRDEKGMTPKEAGWMAALPLLGGALGGLMSGTLQSHLIQRGLRRRWARASIALTGKLAAAGLMLASLVPTSPAAVACLLLVVKFFTDWEQPAEWGAVSDVAGRSAATVFACVNTAGSLGGFVAGPLTGFVLTWFSGGGPTTAGWNAVFVVIALEYLAAASCWLFIDCDRPLEPSTKETI